jgi:2-dehydropantoate 2-reductase
MRILVLGAGALGGYFGGRLLQAGAEVAFLVRPRRRAQLEADGLVVESPYGALRRRPVPLLSPEEAAPGWDVVLLAPKAYDLADAIAAIRPAVDARTAVLPVLNGISHIEALQRSFGAERVLGGLAKIQATLAPDGTVRHLNDWRYLTFGEMDGSMSSRVQALAEVASGAEGMVAAAVPDIAFRLWEKLVHLGTSAVGTVLMRASVGEIVRARPDGAALLLRVLERNAAIAAAHGHPMRESFLSEYRAVFSDPESAYSASILRDLEAGGRIESDHILGFLLEAARRAGVPDELHEAAFLHAKAYEQRRDAGRLPGG